MPQHYWPTCRIDGITGITGILRSTDKLLIKEALLAFNAFNAFNVRHRDERSQKQLEHDTQAAYNSSLSMLC